MKQMDILPYEIMDSFQDFLLNSVDFENFLNTMSFTNVAPFGSMKQISYIQNPKQQTSIQSFPFISFESTETLDARMQEDGFRWYVDIVIGISDMDADNPNHHQEQTDNVLKYTRLRDIQDFGKKVLEIIASEMRSSGIKGDFDINFGRIQHSTTPTGEFDVMYHLIELELISYKEI